MSTEPERATASPDEAGATAGGRVSGASVWVIEQGSYSDYHVVGVYSSREGAQLVADAINGAEDKFGDDATVAEWPLNPAVSELRQGLHPHIVHMLRDGTVERCERRSVSGYEIGGSVEIWRRPTAPACITATVWAKDAEHAIKIVNEHRAAMIASGEWA